MEVPGRSFLNLFDGKIFGDRGDGHGVRRVDLEGGEHFNSLIFADFWVFVTIDGPNPEDAIVLVDPLVEGSHQILGLAVWIRLYLP